jgi:hypothetical protein
MIMFIRPANGPIAVLVESGQSSLTQLVNRIKDSINITTFSIKITSVVDVAVLTRRYCSEVECCNKTGRRIIRHLLLFSLRCFLILLSYVGTGLVSVVVLNFSLSEKNCCVFVP